MDLVKSPTFLLCLVTVFTFRSTNCQNVNPVFPTGSGTLATIAEDETVGTSVYKCTATDANPSNTDFGTLRYFIDPAVSGLFVDANTCDFHVTPGLDYEANTVLTGTLKVEDKGGLRDISSFTIDVSDANDNTPTCSPSTLVGELAEDATSGATIGTFACTDADEAGTVNSEINFQVFPISNAIDVGTTTGIATLKRTVDYETDGPTITATVRVYDKGSPELTFTATVHLEITDLDDNIPVFDSATFTETAPESTPVGTTLIRIAATDADAAGTDNSRITFGLSSACTPDVLLLDSLTGDLILKSALDYEAATTVTCDLTAYSSTKSSDIATATFTLTVEDDNDAAPTFNQTYYTASVSENAVATTLVTQVTATDTDSGTNGQVSYSMTDATNTFVIDSSTGEVTVNTPPNYESVTSYLFTVTAEDAGTPALTSSVYLQILIDPENEFTPSFLDSTSITDIAEDTVPGTSIHQIDISDTDAGVDGEITYSVLTSGVPFFVDSAGAIRITTGLDYEVIKSYEFVVEFSDSSATSVRTATTTYTVAITDSDDTALACEPVSTLTLSGDPNSQLGFVQATLNCSDPDTSAGTFTYVISGGNADNVWEITAGGQVSLISEPTTSQYDLSITVTDSPDSTTVSFTAFTETKLTFTNVPATAVTIDENDLGQTLITATACCAFPELVYSIASGNDDNKATIVSSTGEIKQQVPYDRETTPSYACVIQAVSTSGQTATATYSITVGDANDNTPVFEQNVYEVSVVETLAVSAPIQTYTATDADEGAFATLTYSIVSGNDAGKFALDSGTGALTLAGTLDYDTTSSYELVIHAVDGGSPKLTGTATVVISVQNADDAAPTILPLPGTYAVSLSEDVALGRSVFDVDATDSDGGTSFTFSIESGNTDSDFGIDPSSGYIFVAKFLDRERTNTYTLILTAVDSLFSSTASGTLVVTVGDVNDNDPVFSPSVFEFDIAHDTGISISVGDIVVTDADEGANAAVVATIVSGNLGNAFQLNTLQLDTAIAMDYVTVNQYRLTVQAVDLGTTARTSTTVVVVNVLPDLEQPSFGPTISDTVSVNEDAEVGFQLIDVDATYLGAVEGDGSTLYSIVSGNTGSKFGVRQLYGQVYLAAALDYETDQSYTLVIRAQNSVQTANTADFTLTVNVVNINEHDPIFDQISVPGQNSFSFDVDELSNVGTQVGRVSASDDDIEDPGTVVHTLSGSSDFEIASDTGIITVAGSLDYTVKNLYNLIVTATDEGTTPRSESVSVVVRVVDVNNHSPVFTSADTAQVLDSAPAGSEFYHVHATDVDTGDAGTIKYSIVSDPSVGKITIDADTGILSVAGQLDSVLEPSYALTIKAEDEGVPSLSETQTLTVTVISTEPNYYDPAFPTDPVTASVSRTASAGTAIVAVSATDSDSGASGELVHKIVSGNSDGYFIIDRSSGAISTASSVLTAADTYALTVEASDKGVPSRSTSVTVNIAVDPAVTSFTTPDYVFTVAEGVSVSDLVGEILQDTGRTASGYTIAAGNFDTSFAIALQAGTGKGLLTTVKALDYETFPVYSLLINVDTDIGAFTKVVEVRLTDLNDNPPTFSSNSLTLTLAEHMPVGYTVTTIAVTDADTLAINRDNVLSLSSPGPDLFDIDQSGHLTIATSPDYETVGAQRIFDVVAADQQPPQSSATVTVTVNFVDVVEEEERSLSSLTDNAMIPLEVHFPADNGDIIQVLTAGDFGIEESSSATVQFVGLHSAFPFSLSSTGELTVSDADSLTYPGKYFHWALCRSTSSGGVTTQRASLLRLDTYDRNLYMVVIEFSEAMENVRSGLATFRRRANRFLPDEQRLGISNMIDTSTAARRRLLSTQTAAYTYVVKDTSVDELANIDQDKEFLTEDEILAIFQKSTDGSPANGLSTASMSVDKVEPFTDSPRNNDFAASTAGVALWALLGLFVIVVVVVILGCWWWRSTRDPREWSSKNKRKITRDNASNTTSFLTLSTDRTPPGSAPRGTGLHSHKPGRPFSQPGGHHVGQAPGQPSGQPREQPAIQGLAQKPPKPNRPRAMTGLPKPNGNIDNGRIAKNNTFRT